MTALAMIAAAAERHADRIAVEDGEGRGVMYGELLARARHAAAAIAAGSIVEVPAVRGVDFIAGCIAAWLADAAWIPLDAGEPVLRLAAIRASLASGALTTGGVAYVIPTSGSTGAPKLVMVGHRGLPALFRAQIEAFELAPGARALWLHAPRFDASLSDWAPPWLPVRRW
jgi:non-ribosomal peptide synthetase component F